ncbi:hypothetical protein AB1N83_013441 [Pleurotus pulmonarius]
MSNFAPRAPPHVRPYIYPPSSLTNRPPPTATTQTAIASEPCVKAPGLDVGDGWTGGRGVTVSTTALGAWRHRRLLHRQNDGIGCGEPYRFTIYDLRWGCAWVHVSGGSAHFSVAFSKSAALFAVHGD